MTAQEAARPQIMPVDGTLYSCKEYVPNSRREVLVLANGTRMLRPIWQLGEYDGQQWYVDGRPAEHGTVLAWAEIPEVPKDCTKYLW